MSKSKNIFPIHKRSFFLSLVFLLVTIFVMFNNYFYYKSRDILEKSKVKTALTIIAGQYASCISTNRFETCQAQLVKGINQTWSYARITILNHEGKVIVEKDSELYKENRSTVISSAEIGDGNRKVHIVISKKSSPPLYLSTLRSLTFSIADWLGQENWIDFMTRVAIPRSSTFLSSLGIIWSLLFLIKVSDKQKREINESLESKIFIINNDLQSARENTRSFLSEKQNLERDVEKVQILLKNQEAGEEELLKEYYENKEKLSDLEYRITESKENERVLLASLESNENKSEEIKGDNNQDKKKILQKVLLQNPKVELKEKDFTYNQGPDHSKEFIKELSESMLKDSKCSRIISTINGTDYNSYKRGKAILEWKSKKNIYVLNVYDNNDAGYAAEIVLSKDFDQSIFIAKYLVTTKGYLMKNSFKFEIGSSLNKS
jgi:hypothetical protein